jgi:transposase
MVNEQLRVLARQRQEALRRCEDARLEKIRKLIGLKGIGELSAWPIVMELFGWRVFSNRRQIGSLVGLTGTPYDSGASSRELGIDKAGSGRLRALMTEVAWNWTRYQPRSALTLWFNERFANGGKRLRKIGIVAVARKLLIAIWRYLEQDIIPEGAIAEKA